MTDKNANNSMRTYLLASIPLVVFLGLALIFYTQLKSDNDPSKLPSVLIGQSAPEFPVKPLVGLVADGNQVPAITNEMIAGKVALVNVWASWCVPCRVEHPVITKIADQFNDVLVVGINYKDKNPNALRFLGALGNPYDTVGIDPKGVASIDWGVYGIPESYILSRKGIIVYKHVGPISEDIANQKIIPILNAELAKKK